MKAYISLLRGINVSGQKKIKMAELRAVYESLGFAQVQSYLQSGNVVFQSEESDQAKLTRSIEAGIAAAFGFEVSVLIRDPEVWQHVYESNPYLTTQAEDPKRLYVTFLAEIPDSARVRDLTIPDDSADEFHLDGQHVYLFLPNGAGRSLLSTNFFERKLKVVATARNWNTVTALQEMIKSD